MNERAFRILSLVLARFPSAHEVYMEDMDDIWGVQVFACTPSKTYSAICTTIFDEIDNVHEVRSIHGAMETSSCSWRRYNVEKIRRYNAGKTRRRACHPCT
jgi:hypothetical protein